MNLECANSQDCRQYCDALVYQGIDVFSGETCTLPGMLEMDQTEEGIAVNIRTDNQNPEINADQKELVDLLVGAAATTLIEHERNKDNNGEVVLAKDRLHDIHQKRVELWSQMLQAAKHDRQFTDTELSFYQDRVRESIEAHSLTPLESEKKIRAQAAHDRERLDQDGLLFDDQMINLIDRLTGNLMDGKSTLIMGKKGVAKTQAAKFVSKLWSPEKTPILISGHGDMMSNELMGQVSQDPETGMFYFKEGKLVQAIREERPVIIDEANVADQQMLMRLQEILLLRPGKTIQLQENGDEDIVIPPGFVVFATANEASTRNHHRNVFDGAFYDRLDMQWVDYADVKKGVNPLTQIPTSLMRLATAAAVDSRGLPSNHIDMGAVEHAARLAHSTQYLYSMPASFARSHGFRDGANSTTDLTDITNEPLMTDCITPRTLYETIVRSRPGNKPSVHLRGEIDRLLARLDQDGGDHNQKLARKAQQLLSRSAEV